MKRYKRKFNEQLSDIEIQISALWGDYAPFYKGKFPQLIDLVAEELDLSTSVVKSVAKKLRLY